MKIFVEKKSLLGIFRTKYIIEIDEKHLLKEIKWEYLAFKDMQDKMWGDKKNE